MSASYPPNPVTRPGLIDAIVYKGVISCSTNPNYPAAVVGYYYKVSTSGKIGGALGATVEVGDSIICNVNTVSGTHAAVGANWDILQANTDMSQYASKTTATLTLHVWSDATGTGDGSTKTNAFTTKQAAIDVLPDECFHAVVIIIHKGSTNYLGQTCIIEKSYIKSLTIQGEYYAYGSCESNAVAGKIVHAAGVFTGLLVGDRVICHQYSGSVYASTISDQFYATVTEVGIGYIQTSEATKIPTTGWTYRICQTVLDGNKCVTPLIYSYVPVEFVGICIEKVFERAIVSYSSAKSSHCIFLDNAGVTAWGISGYFDVFNCGFEHINAVYGYPAIESIYGGRTKTQYSTIKNALNAIVISDYGGGSAYVGMCGIFQAVKALDSETNLGSIRADKCLIDSNSTTGAYGYNITLINCTNNAVTPVTNLVSGGTVGKKFYSIIQAIQPATKGATLDQYETPTYKINRAYGLFPAASLNHLIWDIGCGGWNSGKIRLKPVFNSESAGSGSVVFSFDAICLVDGATSDTAWGTAVLSTDTYQGSGKQHIGPEAQITPAGTPPGQVILRATRGTDTLAADVKLLGVWVEWDIS